jgi:hypothetical protein
VGGRVKTLTSRSQHIVPMLPQQTVQPKNKKAYTAAPLCPPEHGTKSSNPCVNGNQFYAASASVMARLGRVPKKGAGEFRGPMRCWLGLEVVVDHPKPTWHTPMCRNTSNAGGGAADIRRLACQTSKPARGIASSIGWLWPRGVAGFAVQGIDKWSVVNINTGVQGQQH